MKFADLKGPTTDTKQAAIIIRDIFRTEVVLNVPNCQTVSGRSPLYRNQKASIREFGSRPTLFKSDSVGLFEDAQRSRLSKQIIVGLLISNLSIDRNYGSLR